MAELARLPGHLCAPVVLNWQQIPDPFRFLRASAHNRTGQSTLAVAGRIPENTLTGIPAYRVASRFWVWIPAGSRTARSRAMKKTTKKTDASADDAPRVRRRSPGGRRGGRPGAPALLRGRNLNDKLNIAFIACGGRASASLSELTITPGAPGAQAEARRRPDPSRSASGRERRRPLRREPDTPSTPRPSVSRRPRSSTISGGCSTARTTSTPSWSRPPSTRTPSPPTWR